jgi:formate dehydrogenase maturation protein FdhE
VIPRGPHPSDRAEPREVSELRTLRIEHPELTPAVDLQLQLLDIQRRVLPRIPLPAGLLGSPAPKLHDDGKPLLTWEHCPVEWNDFRAVLRETTDALLRSGNVEPGDAQFLTRLARDGNRLQVFTEAWFRDRIEGTSSLDDEEAAVGRLRQPGVDAAMSLAFRPFLVRCAAAVGPRLQLETWQRGTCPLCGGDPEMAIVADARDMTLVCSRCTLRWPVRSQRCPYCGSGEPGARRSFASPNRVFRLLACDSCSRYIKAYDERFGTRPAMPAIDTIAMLPLDAVAVQRGYSG